MNFSASDLIKKSAAQILYKEVKKIEWKKTNRQYRGNEYAEEIVKKENASSERRGCIVVENCNLFFCIDMLKDNLAVEIKMIENSYEDWYLHSSILQATFYYTALSKVKTLYTPKFKLKEGYKQEATSIPSNLEFQLWFGDDKYKIFTNEDIYNHYVKKMKLIHDCLNPINFEDCRKFDNHYKFKEFNLLKPKFKLIS